MRRKISALVFDLGGVLTRPQDPECVRDLMDALGLDGAVDVFKAAYFEPRNDYDRGTTDAEGYWRAVCARLGVALPAERLGFLAKRDIDGWMQYRPAMIEALAALRPRVRSMALLSNINVEGAERLRTTFPALGLFDRLTLSCELGLMKPERAIFEDCLRGLGAESGESLFVDDTAENVHGARAAGLHALRFIDEEHFLAELETFYEIVR
jgi:putative hydrolase of the HAD superfamily